MAASTAWYSRLFDTSPALDEDDEPGAVHHAVFTLDGGTPFGLRTHSDSPPQASFDERNTGLDHIAFEFFAPPS